MPFFALLCPSFFLCPSSSCGCFGPGAPRRVPGRSKAGTRAREAPRCPGTCRKEGKKKEGHNKEEGGARSPLGGTEELFDFGWCQRRRRGVASASEIIAGLTHLDPDPGSPCIARWQPGAVRLPDRLRDVGRAKVARLCAALSSEWLRLQAATSRTQRLQPETP